MAAGWQRTDNRKEARMYHEDKITREFTFIPNDKKSTKEIDKIMADAREGNLVEFAGRTYLITSFYIAPGEPLFSFKYEMVLMSNG